MSRCCRLLVINSTPLNNQFNALCSLPLAPTSRYTFRCEHASGTCAAFVNRTIVTAGAPVVLASNTNYRLKLEHQHERWDNYHRLLWAGPYTNATAAAAAAAAEYSIIPAEHYLHEVVCADGCSNRGCCESDGKCRCEAGYGGHDCSLDLSTCGADAPSGSLQAGGLRARYYSDNVFGTVVTEQLDAQAYMAYGVRPAGVPRYDLKET